MTRHRLEAELHRATGVVTQLAAPGDRVASCQPNTLRSFATSWAMMLAGVTEVPVPAASTAAEARLLLADSRPMALLLEADAPDVRAAAAHLGLPVHTQVDAGARAPAAAAPRTRAMSYTSGTTGRRKGVHAGIHDEGWGRQWLDDEHAAFGQRHGPRHLVVSPLYHSGPFRHALVCADRGGSVEVLPRFDLELWTRVLREFRPTSMFCVPTQLHRLLGHEDFRRDDLASLRLLLHAGAPCPQQLKEQLHEVAPDGAVWEFYGSTEGQFTVCPPALWEAAPGTVGTARPDREVVVRDRDGNEVAPGGTGTVWASAPQHARWEYWGLPDATAAAWDGDLFTVGDLGHTDAEGRLFLDGREGDLVISGGVNVYPAEVEDVLRRAPGVADAAVFGMPDAEWGQRVVAAVTAEPGGPTPQPRDVLAIARAELSAPRVPKQVVVVGELPRTPTGKVRRSELPGLVGSP